MDLHLALEQLKRSPALQQRLQHLWDSAHHAIAEAVQALNATGTDSEPYARERKALDLALLHLAKAKWYMGRFNGSAMYLTEFTASEEDAALAEASFARCLQIARDAMARLADAPGAAGPATPEDTDQPVLQAHGTEILFADGVPIVPAICPIVLLEGSSYEMGRQYVEQVVDIFGGWILQTVAHRTFSERELHTIGLWHAHLERLTPEICDLVRGWVDGARALGISLDYWNAIHLWTGHFEAIPAGIKGHGLRDLIPAGNEEDGGSASAYLGGQSTERSATAAHEDLCSGCCAWGEATTQGQLVAGSTTDHDCTFQATVVAYPDTGHAFVYTPFSVIGFIPQLGQHFFAGHPGMNDQGLAYVHHGGGLHGIEGAADRGYGLRRGASTFHNLRYAASTAEALAFELGCPIGDVGTILGSVGGFYADAQGAYVCEARPSSTVGTDPIVRTHSFDGQGHRYSFLYANNNSMHPRSGGGFQPPEGGYRFNPVEGWFEDAPGHHLHLGPARLSPLLSTRSSQGRNRYHFEALKARAGQIDATQMADILRTSAPARLDAQGRPLSREDLERAWLGGMPWPSSVCHRVNAFTSVMQPDASGNGLYMGCIGPANRRARMHIPGHGYHYHDEVNEFWEIRLKPSPEALVDDARGTAERLLAQAQARWDGAATGGDGLAVPAWFEEILHKARCALDEGKNHLQALEAGAPRPAQLRILARALRRFTHSQCRAQQLVTELAHRQPA